MAYTAWSVVFGEQPTAAKWNQLGQNDAGFKDGTNIDSGVITAVKRSQVVKVGQITGIAGNGNKSVTGVGFQPKAVIFFANYPDGVSASQNAVSGLGAMDANGTQWAYCATTRNGNGGSARSVANRCFIADTIAAGGGSRAAAVEGAYVSMDSDGFTVLISSWVNVTTIGYMAIA